MPIIQKIEDSSFTIALWKLEESVDVLMNNLNLDDCDRNTFSAFKLEKRKLEWLASRVLLKSLLNKDCKIEYNSEGKPSISNSEYNISISHSGEYIAVIISNNKKVGIDIEQVSEKLHKVKHKFMNSDELKRMTELDSAKYICAHWCAKEVLTKIIGEKYFDFKKHFPMNLVKIRDKGSFSGKSIENNIVISYLFQYITIEKFLLVWTTSPTK